MDVNPNNLSKNIENRILRDLNALRDMIKGIINRPSSYYGPPDEENKSDEYKKGYLDAQIFSMKMQCKHLKGLYVESSAINFRDRGSSMDIIRDHIQQWESMKNIEDE